MKKEMICDSVGGVGCGLKRVLDLVGGKWKILILCAMNKYGTIRYGELRRVIAGITNTMLAQSLKELEADGLVTRHEYQTIPPKVDYSLTERGEAVLPALNEIYKWGSEQMQLKVKNAPEDESFQK